MGVELQFCEMKKFWKSFAQKSKYSHNTDCTVHLKIIKLVLKLNSYDSCKMEGIKAFFHGSKLK
jgi:hypothetical protein